MNPKPKILILSTGGTIASINGQPVIDGRDLVQAVPQIQHYAHIEAETFSKMGSSQLAPAHWLKLAKRINAILEQDASLTGIVLTHGTDTMEETAFFLNLTVKSKKPIILVGAMRSANEISADGPANLLNAVRVAADKNAANKGVLIVLNERISAARNAIKLANRNVATFQTLEFGHVGLVDPDKVLFYQNPLRPHTYQTEFSIKNLNSLPKVEIIQDFTGFDPAILSYFFNKDIAGLVLQTFAGGRISAGASIGLEQVKPNKMPLVIASGVISGRIIGQSPYTFPAVFSNDFRANKARILLMLILTKNSDLTYIQHCFNKY